MYFISAENVILSIKREYGQINAKNGVRKTNLAT